ncbi:MAG: flagellar assembly peptidoglycan hydrolase FlgJ [Betaproteobacteria bacterium]|nr:flagellar assembly peptidoglycan hydrolase FlgJ [Betaproteobacteria bacterium]
MMPVTTSLADKLAFDVQSADAMRAKARAGDAETLRSTAREFEAMVVNMMMKTMRQTRFDDPENELFGGQALQMYRDMLDQQWSRKVTEGRGFGMADMLMRQFSAQQAKPTAGEGAVPQADAEPSAYRLDQVPRTKPAPDMATESGAPAPAVELPEAARQFMQRLRPHADAAAQRLGVPAEYVLAHAALESGWGQREIKRADGGPSYNLFGIKAGQGWQGEAAQVQTTEYQYGLPVKKQEAFRAYGGYAEAFDDYARLLERRYAGAIGQADALAFSNGLQQAGYASDPRYGEKLSRLIGQLT